MLQVIILVVVLVVAVLVLLLAHRLVSRWDALVAQVVVVLNTVTPRELAIEMGKLRALLVSWRLYEPPKPRDPATLNRAERRARRRHPSSVVHTDPHGIVLPPLGSAEAK
jgi:hypothetical protein